MEILNLQDNGDGSTWRWTWDIQFDDDYTRSYATNASGNGLFDVYSNYQQLKGKGQFSLAGKSLNQAKAYIKAVWRQ